MHNIGASQLISAMKLRTISMLVARSIASCFSNSVSMRDSISLYPYLLYVKNKFSPIVLCVKSKTGIEVLCVKSIIKDKGNRNFSKSQ